MAHRWIVVDIAKPCAASPDLIGYVKGAAPSLSASFAGCFDEWSYIGRLHGGK